MKFIKILQSHRQGEYNEIYSFIQKNMTQEMINGLEYDEPETIKRALKLFGIEYDPETKTSHDLKIPPEKRVRKKIEEDSASDI